MIKTLIAKGYYISKEKGLETEPTKAQYQAPQKNKNNNLVSKQNTTSQIESQDLERYTLDQIHELLTMILWSWIIHCNKMILIQL